MRCISTFAVMDAIDPELGATRRRFAAHLAETSPAAGHGTDPASLWASGSWTYRCSIPRRQEDGAILYVHISPSESPPRQAGGRSVASL
jgi:hypothetical protein